MYPATMDAPMAHEHAQIYLRAGAKAHAFKHGKTESEFWEMMGGQMVEDSEVMNSQGRYYYTYQRLCSDIRKKVVNAQKQRERDKRRQKPTRNEDSDASIKPQEQVIQLSIF